MSVICESILPLLARPSHYAISRYHSLHDHTLWRKYSHYHTLCTDLPGDHNVTVHGNFAIRHFHDSSLNMDGRAKRRWFAEIDMQ